MSPKKSGTKLAWTRDLTIERYATHPLHQRTRVNMTRMRVNNMLQNIHTYDCTCRRNSPIDYHNNTANLETGNLQSMQNITEHFNHTPNMRHPSAFSDFVAAVAAIRPLTLQQHTHLLRQQMRCFDIINMNIFCRWMHKSVEATHVLIDGINACK